jgi:hypothetical protein
LLQIDDIVEDLGIWGTKEVVGCLRRSLLRAFTDAVVEGGEDS